MSNSEKNFKQSTKEKGKIVESIVALLHENQGITVKRNVHLRSNDGSGSREIDILISGELAGYPIQIAIECKNYKREIGVSDIDAFIGKLNGLGFPTQHGIYVCTSRYTKGALKNAKKAGIKTLTLSGLTKDRLSAAIYDALQLIIYLFPIMTSLTFHNDVPEATAQELGICVNESGDKLIIFDLILANWCKGKYPYKIGNYSGLIDIPKGYTQYSNGKRVNSFKIELTLKVVALVVQVPGKAQFIQLINSYDTSIEKKNLNVSFETENRSFKVDIFHIEQELENFLRSRLQQFSLTLGRIPLPSMLTTGGILWPPTKKFMDNLNQLIKENNGILNLQDNLFALHGENIFEAALKNNIWEGHPASKKKV